MAVSPKPKHYRSAPYNAEIAQQICERLSNGEFLHNICKTPGYPAQSTVRLWALNDTEGFTAMYARAKDIGYEVVADSLVDIADTSRKGKVTEKKVVGRDCSSCGRDLRWLGGWKHSEDGTVICPDSKAQPVVEEKVRTADMVERARLQIDARKWLLSKMRPGRYGDHLTLAGDPAAPLVVHRVEFASPTKPGGD